MSLVYRHSAVVLNKSHGNMSVFIHLLHITHGEKGIFPAYFECFMGVVLFELCSRCGERVHLLWLHCGEGLINRLPRLVTC